MITNKTGSIYSNFEYYGSNHLELFEIPKVKLNKISVE